MSFVADSTIRAAALAACQILDTPPEEDYDDLTELACTICQTPIALITLIDGERQWFKSMKGVQIHETQTQFSFCVHAINNPDQVMVVPDATRDDRFSHNWFVTDEPNIRFYAGAPLVLENGIVLGTLCVLDLVPRQLTSEQIKSLKCLAKQVTRLVDDRRVMHTLVETQEHLKAVSSERAKMEAQYHALFESHPTAMILHDATTDEVLAVNPAAEMLYGISAEEFLGLSFSRLSSVEDQAGADLAERFRVPKENGFSAQIAHHKRKDGSALTVEIRSNLMQLGERICRIVSIVDVSRRTEMEMALKRIQREYATAFEHAPIGMALVYLDSRVFRVNHALCELLGYTEDELFLKRCTPLTHPDDRAIDKIALDSLVAGTTKSFRLEKRYIHKSGREIWAFFSACLVRDESGRPLHYVAQIQDITETKLAKNALRESQARLNLIFTAQAEGIVVQDQTGKIVLANPAANDILGFQDHEIETRSSVDEKWRTIREDGTPFPGEFHPSMVALKTGKPSRDVVMGVQRSDGKLVWISINASPLLDGTSGPMVVCSFSDITEKKLLEDQLRQSQKMEVVGRLAGGVAHDFNNLLTAMLLNLQEAMQTEPDRDWPLREVHSLATQGAKLTRQLLGFARQQPMALVPVEINSEVSKFINMICRIIGDTVKITINQRAHETWVEADVAMLDQALMNIMVNARDAMPNGGTISVITEVLDIETPNPRNRYAREGKFYKISIQDTGTGMSAETLEHLFEPFYTTKEIGKGTGLGLPSADGTVHQHKGWIEVDSQLGFGSTFSIYLPVTNKRPKQEAALAAVKSSQSETILLVEDHPTVRKVTVRILQKLGYQVLTAGDGVEALSVWKEHSASISLLLTDMMMPNGISGLALGKQLREERPNLKIILVSGFSDEIIKEQGIDLPNVRFLSKPYEHEVLSRNIREILDGS